MQFVRPGVVLAQMAPERSNPNWDVLHDNRDAAREPETDAAGRRLEVVEMPVLPYVDVGGERFVVPYTNYYPVNGGIVAPQVGEADDEVGFALLRELFADREVVGAPSRLLAYGGGGIGCITQQTAGRGWPSSREEVAPMIRTGEEYRESMRDGREVWIDGERVHDVTTHPAVQAARRRPGPHLRHGARRRDSDV